MISFDDVIKSQNDWCDKLPLTKLLVDKIQENSQGTLLYLAPTDDENTIEPLVQKGMFFDDYQIIQEPMEPNNCNINCQKKWIKLLETHKKKLTITICTGYSLDKNLWIQHCWLVDEGKKCIYETTLRAERYYGYCYHRFECLNNVYHNKIINQRDFDKWLKKLDLNQLCKM